MKLREMRRGFCGCACALVVVVMGAVRASEAGIPAYSLVGTYELPGGVASFDVMPDGRVLGMVGDSFVLQDAVNGSGFTTVGSIAAGNVAAFGAAFLRVNPSGTKVAIGDNQLGIAQQDVLLVDVGTFDAGMASPFTAVAAPNYDAAWRDDDTLYVVGTTGFVDPALVTEIEVGSLAARVVVDNVQGAAGGVAFVDGHLLTSNGFEFGAGSETGEVRAFALAQIDGGAVPIDFEVSGIAVADALSGASLGVDALGNLLVGGSDAFGSGDGGYAGVIDGDAIASALQGGTLAPDSSELHLTPASVNDFYLIQFNEFTGEVLVSAFGSPTVYRYAVPSPGSALVVALGGVAAWRRRRDG